MPYLSNNRKKEILEHKSMEVSGDLNYQVTLLVIQYLNDKGLCYQTCNDIVGALDNAKAEFKVRVQNPYEKLKRFTNGDVYPKKFLNGGVEE